MESGMESGTPEALGWFKVCSKGGVMPDLAAQAANQARQQDMMARGAWTGLQVDRTIKAGVLANDVSQLMAKAEKMNAMEASVAFGTLKDRAGSIGGVTGEGALGQVKRAEYEFTRGDHKTV